MQAPTVVFAVPPSRLRWFRSAARRWQILHAVSDAVVPEAVEALQQLVHLRELALADAADLFDRADVAIIELGDGFCDFLAFLGQADADRAAVDARTLVVDETEVDQLLDVVGNVGAEIVTAIPYKANGSGLR